MCSKVNFSSYLAKKWKEKLKLATNLTVADESWNCEYPVSLSMCSAFPTDRLNVYAAKDGPAELKMGLYACSMFWANSNI